MRINQENYEAYFIDYLDGNLSDRELEELKAFLLINDDLADLLEDINTTRLNIPVITYPYKQGLFRDIIHECRDYYAIAIAEKAITKEDELFLRHHLLKQELQEQVSIYKKLRLIPNTTLHCPSKNKLFQRKRINSYSYLSIAALLLLLIGLRILMPEIPEDICIITSNKNALAIIKEDTNIYYIKKYDNLIDTVSCKSEINKTNNIPIRQNTTIERTPILSVILLPEDRLSVGYTVEELDLMMPVLLQIYSSEITLYASAKEWDTSIENSSTTNIISSMIHVGKNLAKRIKNREEKENTSNKMIFQSIIW